MSTRSLATIVVALTIVGASAGCAPTQNCTPGATQQCLCPDLSMSAQVCSDDGQRWLACQCGDAGTDGGDASTDSGPPGPMVTCTSPGATADAVLMASITHSANAHPFASLQFYSGGALASIDGVSCTLDPNQSTMMHALCFDRYICGGCHIEISRLDTESLTGDCDMYNGTYSLCPLTSPCRGTECGQDSCGQTCGTGMCSGGQVCNSGVCETPACPSGCMVGSVCCGGPFCSGNCVGTPCC